MAKAKVFNTHAWIVHALRRASYRWPARYKAKAAAKVARNQYRCAHCPPDVLHGNKDIQLDHIVPIVDPIEGFTTWDSYIGRLLCGEEGIQCLCKPHHKIKTEKENAGRTRKKRAKKV